MMKIPTYQAASASALVMLASMLVPSFAFGQSAGSYGVVSSAFFGHAAKAADPNHLTNPAAAYKRLQLAIDAMKRDVKIAGDGGLLMITLKNQNAFSVRCQSIASKQAARGEVQMTAQGCGNAKYTLSNKAGPYSYGVGGDMLPYGQVATLRTLADLTAAQIGGNNITEKQDWALQAGYNVASKKVEYSPLSKRMAQFQANELSHGLSVYYPQSGGGEIIGLSYIKPGVKMPGNYAPHADASETFSVMPAKNDRMNIAAALTIPGNQTSGKLYADIKKTDITYVMSAAVPGLVRQVRFKDKTGAEFSFKIFDDTTGVLDLQKL